MKDDKIAETWEVWDCNSSAPFHRLGRAGATGEPEITFYRALDVDDVVEPPRARAEESSWLL